MDYLIVEDGIITNVIVAEADFAEEIGAFPYYAGAGIGDAYNPPPPAPPTPTADEDRDALLVDLEYRIALLELGVV